MPVKIFYLQARQCETLGLLSFRGTQKILLNPVETRSILCFSSSKLFAACFSGSKTMIAAENKAAFLESREPAKGGSLS
jgi:hypothetical protein